MFFSLYNNKPKAVKPLGFSQDSLSNYSHPVLNPYISNMNGNDERGIVPVVNSRKCLTVKIDSLCIKLGITKEKDDAPKCRHFSIRGYVAGMREKGSSKLLPFTEELPPMDIPNFRYWLCQKCLQNNETANASSETTSVSVCDQCVFPPARSCPPQDLSGVAVLPFVEGTSGLKPIDSMSDDETILAALGGHDSQTSQEIPLKVNVSQEPTNCSTIGNNAGQKEVNGLKYYEDSQIVNESISQPIDSGQQNDIYPNGHPRRKARKVRLLKELLCRNTEIQQRKKQNLSPRLMVPSSQIKRKMLHDHHLDHDHEYHRDHKRTNVFKEDAVAKTSVDEHSRNQETRELGDKYEWNKHGTQRSSILGKVSKDAVTARVLPTYTVPKSRGTEPYSNFMNPPKSDTMVNSSKKITSTPTKSNFFVEDSRNMGDDIRSHTELGLDLSLNYDRQSYIPSQPSVLNQSPSQDYNRKSSYFLGESSNFPYRIPSDLKSRESSDQEKRLYTQLPYVSCSGHQKLDFSEPYKRNIGVKGYPEFTRPNNHQRQEKMLSYGRPDEHEIVELLAKSQYKRNLCEANNGITSGFRNHNMNERMTQPNERMTVPHREYFSMMRPSSIPTSENVGPLRNTAGSFFHQDQVSSFTMNQKKPVHGVWIPDSRSQRHYDSHYHYESNGNFKEPQTLSFTPTNMHVREAFNKYNNGGKQTEAASMRLAQTYAKYPEKDKGKNMMDLDLNLNLVAPNVVEERNYLEPFDLNPHRVCSSDSSYSNETIPAMQLLSLMDAGKSCQPFSLTGQPYITKPKPKPISNCYSHCSSTVTEKTNPLVNPIGSSLFNVFQTGQNVKLNSSHGQQVYHKPQEKSRGTSLASVIYRREDSYVSPLPWHANEGQNKLVNKSFGPKFDSSRTETCTINQNPADFSIPGPENVYMISDDDLVYSGWCSYRGKFTSENAFGPKSQRKVMRPAC